MSQAERVKEIRMMRIHISDFNFPYLLSDEEIYGKCPFCHSDDFHYNRNGYVCENCDAQGDAISLLMCRDKKSYFEAVEEIYKMMECKRRKCPKISR